MKKILMFILIAAMLCTAFVSCGNKSDLAAIEESGKLVVGVTRYKPMDYLDDETGEWIGFDAELAQMFAEELGVNCQLVIIPWSNKVAELNGRQIDLVWNGMTITEERKTNMAMSVPYLANKQARMK